MRKVLVIAMVVALLGAAGFQTFADSSDWKNEYPWAVEGVEYCLNNKIMTGDNYGDLMLDRHLTRSQAAKMITVAFGLQKKNDNSFADADVSKWDYEYISSIEDYVPKKSSLFRGGDDITREEFTSVIACVLGYSSDYDNTLSTVFSDASKIDPAYKGYVLKTVKAGIIQGSNGCFRAKAALTRAEACVIMKRAESKKLVQGVIANAPSKVVAEEVAEEAVYEAPQSDYNTTAQEFTGSTNILGAPQITLNQAQAWARSKGATERFVGAATNYWYYGELMGIRPEIMYAQAAHETGFGKYTGVVSEDMNNFAGIKVKGRNDDAKDAHQAFPTLDDGVRAHFNHMAAYVGVEPVGTPHDRYYSVKSLDWAGTIRTLEELSGKWCPNPEYAKMIIEGCLIPMSKFEK